jgi:hypothetical protein
VVLWAAILPLIGVFIFLFNFWRPGSLGQSRALLAGALIMGFIVLPMRFALLGIN